MDQKNQSKKGKKSKGRAKGKTTVSNPSPNPQVAKPEEPSVLYTAQEPGPSGSQSEAAIAISSPPAESSNPGFLIEPIALAAVEGSMISVPTPTTVTEEPISALPSEKETSDSLATSEIATTTPSESAMSAKYRRDSMPLVLEIPKATNTGEFPQDPNFLTTPTTGGGGREADFDHGSFPYPKSDSGSTGAAGRNRKLSGYRGDERVRKISIGLGGVPKKGYWGGMDDSDDSDDSLLAQSKRRKRSSSFVTGPKLMGYNRRQWLILIVIAVVDFCSAVLISIQTPIYPREALSKGSNATTYGILFGVFELTVFLMSPTFFNLLRKVDMKIMFNFGIVVTGTSAILFSFLDRVDDLSLFIACSFVLQICGAVGDAAILTAAYAIVTLEFPDAVADTFTSLEAFLGIGFIVGPPLGGILYDAGGFMLPFLLFGVLLLVTAVLSLALLPKLREDSPSGELRKPAFLTLLQIPSVAVAGLSILTATISLGFLNATLYAHLTQFMLTAPTIGAIFVVQMGMYSLSAPVWNIIINRVEPKIISVLSTLLIFVAFLFVGPVSFLPVETNLDLTCAALALAGLALGGLLVSGFIVIMKDTIAYGFPDTEATFGMSSGLYASLFAFGSFIGLSFSGILYDTVGFRWACLFPLAIHVLLAIITISYSIFGRRPSPEFQRSRHPSAAFQESEPLLSRSPDPVKPQFLLDSQSERQTQSPPSTAGPVKSSYGSTSYESIA